MDYGAQGDGVTDDAPDFQACLDDSVATGKPVIVPPPPGGFYRLASTLYQRGRQGRAGVTPYQEFRAAAQGVTLQSEANVGLSIEGWCTRVRGLTFDLRNAPASAIGVRLNNTDGVLNRVEFDGVTWQFCPTALADDAGAANYLCGIEIRDCVCWLTRGPQILLHRCDGGGIHVCDTVLDTTQNQAAGLFGVYSLAEFRRPAGLELDRVDFVGGNNAAPANAAANALVIDGTAPAGAAVSHVRGPAGRSVRANPNATGAPQGYWVRMNRVMVDSWKGSGIRITNISELVARDIETYACWGDGVNLDGVSMADLDNILTRGGAGIPGAVQGACGLRLTDCSDITGRRIRSFTNTGPDLVIYGHTPSKTRRIAMTQVNAPKYAQVGDVADVSLSVDFKTKGT